mmetsp:Transcript_19133/g.31238  ORF Transcript_19133/g.31238 Transcript_19133/m.31238 type:complete len:167 (+) Transcript_19133:847-1347(+)
MQLDVKVKASLQKKKFDLPHRSVRMYPLSTVTTTDMVKLMCCGYVGCCASRKKAKSAVRNEKGAEDDTNKQEFDAWPSERHEKRWITPSVLLQSIWRSAVLVVRFLTDGRSMTVCLGMCVIIITEGRHFTKQTGIENEHIYTYTILNIEYQYITFPPIIEVDGRKK